MLKEEFKIYMSLVESTVFALPCLLIQSWFFCRVGGWQEKVATWVVQYHYGSGMYWEHYKQETFIYKKCLVLRSFLMKVCR